MLAEIVREPEDSKQAASLADQFMLQDYYGDRTSEAIAKEFGPQFAVAVEKLKPGSWQGPIESGYGWHLVFVASVSPGRTPTFDEVELDVKTAWLENGLEGKSIEFPGLQATITDVIVRVELLDGRNWTAIVRPSQPWLEITPAPEKFAVARAYVRLGIEHILTGVDHLLFVSGLLLLVSGVRRLLFTVSAFTLSHTITLTLATLGFVRVPPAPVEAVIALSIFFVAYEVLRKHDDRDAHVEGSGA